MPVADRSVRTPILLAFILSVGASGAALAYNIVQLGSIGQRLAVLDRGYLPLAAVTAELGAITRQLELEQGRPAPEGAPAQAARRASAAFFSAGMAAAELRGHSVVEAALVVTSDREERTALALLDRLLSEAEGARQRYDEARRAREEWTAPTGAPAVDAASEGPGEAEAEERAGADGPLDEQRALDEAVVARRGELVLRVARLRELVEDRIETVSARTARAQRRAYTVGGALAAISLLLSGLLSVAALATLRPISELVAQVQRLREAGTTGRVATSADGEVGLLVREWNAMAEEVAERDRRLKERAEMLDRLSLRLRGVLDTIQVGIVVAERGAAVMVNPAARRLFGAAEGASLPASLRPLQPGRTEALPFGDRLLNVDLVPFGLRGALIVGEDVTERIRDRERLARSERLALVGQMLAQVTHEVRNPLNAMSLHAEILCDELGDPEQLDMMRTITGEIRRIEAVTGRYLELSRGRRAELSLAEPAEVCREVLRVDEEALRRAGAVASLVPRLAWPEEADPPLSEGSALVELDADALRRALRNLLKNAAEAGAGRVEVCALRREGGLLVRVADDGPGMDEDTARAAFDPFYTTKAQGTGLGLAITRQELEEVGGHIRCARRPGGGMIFELALPVDAEARRALPRGGSLAEPKEPARGPTR